MAATRFTQQTLRWSLLGMVGFIGVCFLGNWAAAQAPPLQPMTELRGPNTPGEVLFQVGQEPKHWVGIYCRPLDEALRAQLQMERGTGVVIDGVAANSPAEKAGLRRHDVLIAVGRQPLKDPVELMKMVEQAGKRELAFDVIRGAKKLTLQVTPAERPEAREGEAFQIPRQNLDALRHWVDRLEDPAHGPLHLRGFGPGVMFGPRELPPLPEDVSIQINKTGGAPAKVLVSRGEEKWELTDQPDQLQQLPDDIRPAVESLLGRGASYEVRVPGPRESSVRKNPGAEAEPQMEKRMQELERRLEQLLKELRAKPK